jgi:multidrug resistance efflux pump
MIVFLTVSYILLLLLAFKLKWVKPTLAWKLSPIAWCLLLLIALFIPMQFWAPSGPFIVGQHSVQIVPNVQGEVVEVNVDLNQEVKEGDLLFRIDPTLYQSRVDTVESQLKLARTRLDEAKKLAERGAGSMYDVEQFSGQVEQLEAQLAGARYNLEETSVRAPADGYVTSVGLRAGARVTNIPLAKAMAFVESADPFYASEIFQNHLRYIEPGQAAEVALKMYPGRVFDATVSYVVAVSPTGQIPLSGVAAPPKELPHTPFWVVIEAGEELKALQLPVGATGTIAIYTGAGAATHVIRKVVLRLEAIKNYIVPN